MKKLIAYFIIFTILCGFTVSAADFDAQSSLVGKDLTVTLSSDSENTGIVNIYVMKPSKELKFSDLSDGLHDIKQVNMIDTLHSIGIKFGSDDLSGDYTVYSVSKYGTALNKVTFLNDTDKLNLVLSDIKTSSNASQIIFDNLDILGLSEDDTAVFRGFSESQMERFNTLLKAKGNFDTKEKFMNSFKEISMIADIDTSPYTQLEEKLRGYTILGIDFSEYNNLTSSSKTKALKEVAQQVLSSITEIKTAFANAVKANKTISTGKGSSGGGGRTSSPITMSPEYVEAVKSEEPSVQIVFKDLESVAWAKESIEYLYNKGVINGKSEGVFDPNGNVTREEFIKMLVGALNVKKSSSNFSPYSDVGMNEWYFEYVLSATELGIVKGDEAGQFGVGENIIRQDMAIICYRALENAKIPMPVYTNTVSFVDGDLIDEYAVEGVINMAKSNIISGVGNGKFMPQENATRAEAAKIICEIMKLAINKG